LCAASDLESIRALFNEKEKELTMAVAKVDELTRQLEDVQKGRGHHSQPTSPASMELDKLRAELLVSIPPPVYRYGAATNDVYFCAPVFPAVPQQVGRTTNGPAGATTRGAVETAGGNGVHRPADIGTAGQAAQEEAAQPTVGQSDPG